MSEAAAFRSEGRSERESDWQVAHEQLVGLARSRAGLDFEEGRWLVAALRGGAHVWLGYGSFFEYVERLFGYGPRLTQDKLRVAEALGALPLMAQALRQGQICWSALRELTRVATPETESEWLGAAQGKTAREVERLVSGHLPGSQPGDAPSAAARRHVLRFEVSGDVLGAAQHSRAERWLVTQRRAFAESATRRSAGGLPWGCHGSLTGHGTTPRSPAALAAMAIARSHCLQRQICTHN